MIAKIYSTTKTEEYFANIEVAISELKMMGFHHETEIPSFFSDIDSVEPMTFTKKYWNLEGGSTETAYIKVHTMITL